MNGVRDRRAPFAAPGFGTGARLKRLPHLGAAGIITGVHLSLDSLEAGLDEVRRAPIGTGRVELIARRPAVNEREVLTEAILDPIQGLVGDTWNARPSKRSDDGGPHPQMQLNIMNARAIALIAGSMDRWALAGDQFYVDLDISEAALPAGARLQMGTALIQVSEIPHTGCAKFADRFGSDARRFVNTPEGRALRLRGLNAAIVDGGIVRPGDAITLVR